MEAKKVKVIVAQFTDDWVQPYCGAGQGIPVVVVSNHPRFQPGHRFDYGFLQVALAQGYAVVILPTGKPMTQSEQEAFGEADPVEISATSLQGGGR